MGAYHFVDAVVFRFSFPHVFSAKGACLLQAGISLRLRRAATISKISDNTIPMTRGKNCMKG